MTKSEIKQQVLIALAAAQEKKAEDITVLELGRESSTFTDYFLICSGSNPRQVQAIADEVDERLSKGEGLEPNHREGYQQAEWVLLDYVDFVVHIFSRKSRGFYDLERLWKDAKRLEESDLKAPARRPAAKKAVKAPSVKTAAKTAAKPAAKRASGTGAKRKPASRATSRRSSK